MPLLAWSSIVVWFGSRRGRYRICLHGGPRLRSMLLPREVGSRFAKGDADGGVPAGEGGRALVAVQGAGDVPQLHGGSAECEPRRPDLVPLLQAALQPAGGCFPPFQSQVRFPNRGGVLRSVDREAARGFPG
jgi:hypothetical protein